MCVAAIIYKPVSERYMSKMEDTNPHGAGVAWLVEEEGKKTIRWSKGLKAKQIFEMQSKGELTYPYIMHYRWATHGPKVAELTHPFPLGPDAFFHGIKGTAPQVLMHNGVWHKYDQHLPSWLHHSLLNVLSDSQVAAWYAYYDEAILDEIDWATVVMRVDKNAQLEIITRGRWMKFEDNYYSNLNWVPWSDREENKNKIVTSKTWVSNYNSSHRDNVTGDTSDDKEKEDWWHSWKPCPKCEFYQCQCEAGDAFQPTGRGSRGGFKPCDTDKTPIISCDIHEPRGREVYDPEKPYVFNGKPVSIAEYNRLKEELDTKVFAHYTSGPSLVDEKETKAGTLKLTELNPDIPQEQAMIESLILSNNEMSEQEMVEALQANRARERLGYTSENVIEVLDSDIISEDPDTVNQYLAKQAMQAMSDSKKKVAM